MDANTYNEQGRDAIVKLLTTAILGCAMLTGCVHRPSTEEIMAELARIEAETPPDVRAMMESSMAARIKQIQPGQTLQGQLSIASEIYSFQAEPGSQVTVTVRSEVSDTSLSLHHVTKAMVEKPIALDQSYGRSFDINGPNSEVVITLPPDDDKTYFILVHSMPKNGAMPQAGGAYSLSLVSGAAPAQDILRLPQPILGSGGKYMSPFTEDDTVAPWVEKGLTVSAGMSTGSAVGNLAAASQNGGAALVGAGATLAARELALQAVGGWDFIKANSDLSFNSAADLARDLHFRHAGHPQYKDVLTAVYPIYPEVQGEIQLLERDQAAEAATAAKWSKGQ
ncbi:hypothetical protein M2318_003300 [Metapseudomonas resinovorans]|uniref:hypothetical protein n=1 Tax=Metapseudomonas resinovorans TaxID=53412 RepID=UPI003D1B8345